MNLTEAEKSLIFKCIAGSHAYGTVTEVSDADYRGVFTVPSDLYFSLNKKVEEVSDAKNDTTYYTLKRFLDLLCIGNPNVIEYLWMPNDCVLLSSAIFEQIKEIRHTFITRKLLDALSGYAYSQIKKAKGQNKLINNPVSEKKPIKEDFCWVLPMEIGYNLAVPEVCYSLQHGEMPFRPRKLIDEGYPSHLVRSRLSNSGDGIVTEVTEFDLSKFHVSKVEHCDNMYRLYHYGDGARGVFRGDDSADIVCESIPIDHEYARFAGILIYHKDAYERELKLWHQYWGWRENRNEARWAQQETDEVDVRFDRKNMMHCMRLLYSGESVLKNGYPIVRFEGELLQRLKDIRAGKIAYEEILAEAESRMDALSKARETCGLPTTPNFVIVNELSVRLHKQLL